MLKKLAVVLMVCLFCGLAAEGAELFSYPMDTSICEAKVEFGEFVKKAGCLSGEYWFKKTGEPATGEPVYVIADGEVVEIYTDPNSLAKTVVLEHLLPGGEKVYSVYNGIDSPTFVGETGTQGDLLGTVKYDVLYFAVKTKSWSASDKTWLKGKYAYKDWKGYVSPSLFIDLRSGIIDVPLADSAWTSFEVPATICRQMTYVSRNGDGMLLDDGLGLLVDYYGKYNGHSAYLPDLSGFIEGDNCQLRALKDNVEFHAYVPTFDQLAELALADLVKMGTAVNAEVMPKVVGKTFKKADGVLQDYLVWKLKAKVAKPYQVAYGKSAMLYIAIDPQNPLDRPFGLEPSAIGNIYWGSVPADFNWVPAPFKSTRIVVNQETGETLDF